ncbi:hypothetical protein CBS101457_001812 [Exobasidium rhododendri]|nr:hypothetical protein CBS101457_001812 [Exobasidium rhododendri]
MHLTDFVDQLQAYAINANEGRKHDEPSNALLRESAQQVADELAALQSIFGNESLDLLPLGHEIGASTDDCQNDTLKGVRWKPDQPSKLSITVPLDVYPAVESDGESFVVRLSAILPSGYPQGPNPPQLQLLSRYVGPHRVDHTLVEQIRRIFSRIESPNCHLDFHPGEVVLFEGIEMVREIVGAWYSEREAKKMQKKEGDELVQLTTTPGAVEQSIFDNLEDETISPSKQILLVNAPAITERKSIFVGHCSPINDPAQVPLVLEEILKDRKVARASHPTMYAWICRAQEGGIVLRDCYDDGETAAGGRLAHLLDLLHLENVIVVVTRWYGGVHLGADRFKLINRAARDALEIAQLVPGPLN